ncbi:uncharacterized protein LOC101864336 [Aplysia californica]|uniref:Glycosyltransferase family 92 protein n=1 Tax=Aplysia californica TaxID=6500 RepID=A0ABM0K5B9_APLCA|nr:uncharacterized protein LOC101864336 [Aplysia californica]
MLLQSITFNRLMGVGHMYIYNQSVGPMVDALLRHYTDRGLLTVLPMPKRPANKAWYHGQDITIQDCIYRNRNTSQFVVVVDPDEFIVPLQHKSWGELLSDVLHREAKQNHVHNVGSFTFIHAFLCDRSQKHDDPHWTQLKQNFSITEEEEDFIRRNKVILFLEKHRQKFHSYPRRSKTIYRPEFVREPGIHYPRKLWSNQSQVVVDTSLSYVAHFRYMYDGCLLDTSAFRFYRDYLNLLKTAYDEFQSYVSSP